jgi:dihydroflavonol-4-reductase
MMARVTGRKRQSLRIPPGLARITAAAMEFAADRAGPRPPLATRESVEIALRSKGLSSERAKRELGYAPRPLEAALRDTIAWINQTTGPTL